MTLVVDTADDLIISILMDAARQDKRAAQAYYFRHLLVPVTELVGADYHKNQIHVVCITLDNLVEYSEDITGEGATFAEAMKNATDELVVVLESNYKVKLGGLIDDNFIMPPAPLMNILTNYVI